MRRTAFVVRLVLSWLVFAGAARASELSSMYRAGKIHVRSTGATVQHYFWTSPSATAWYTGTTRQWLSVGKTASGEFQAVVAGMTDHNGALAGQLKQVTEGAVDDLRREILRVAPTLKWSDRFTYFGFHGGSATGIPSLAVRSTDLNVQARVIMDTLHEANHYIAVTSACHGGEFGPELLTKMRQIAVDAGEDPALYRLLVADGPGSSYGMEHIGVPGSLYYRMFGHGKSDHIFKRFAFADADAVNMTVGTPKAFGRGNFYSGDWYYYPNMAGRLVLNLNDATRRAFLGARAASQQAWAAARWAATKQIAGPVFSRGPWWGRMGVGAIGGWALGTAVETGVAGLTHNEDIGAAAGYAAGAYGAYATESVFFGTSSGSMALGGAIWFLPVAVHLHITGRWINGPLEQAIANGDPEAQKLYDEFNWGFPGLGALVYGAKQYYFNAADGIAGLLP